MCLMFIVGIQNVLVKAVAGGGGFPYYVRQGKPMFLIGQDSQGWSDFGGSAKQGENVLATAAREFSEETRDVFGNGNRNASKTFFDQHNKGSLAHPQWKYFTHLIEVPQYIPATTFNTAKSGPDTEKMNYEWIDADQFLTAISNSGHSLNAPFTFNGKNFRPFFIDTIQNNLNKIRNTVFKGHASQQYSVPSMSPLAAAAAATASSPILTQQVPASAIAFTGKTAASSSTASKGKDIIVAVPEKKFADFFQKLQNNIVTILNATYREQLRDGGIRYDFQLIKPSEPTIGINLVTGPLSDSGIELRRIDTSYRNQAERKFTPAFFGALGLPQQIWFGGINVVIDPNNQEQMLIIAYIGDSLGSKGLSYLSGQISRQLNLQSLAKMTGEAPRVKLGQHIRLARMWLTRKSAYLRPINEIAQDILANINQALDLQELFSFECSLDSILYVYHDHEQPTRTIWSKQIEPQTEDVFKAVEQTKAEGFAPTTQAAAPSSSEIIQTTAGINAYLDQLEKDLYAAVNTWYNTNQNEDREKIMDIARKIESIQIPDIPEAEPLKQKQKNLSYTAYDLWKD